MPSPPVKPFSLLLLLNKVRVPVQLRSNGQNTALAIPTHDTTGPDAAAALPLPAA